MWLCSRTNTYSELAFQSAAVSREESAVLLAEADSSPVKAEFGMTMVKNAFTNLHHYPGFGTETVLRLSANRSDIIETGILQQSGRSAAW